MGSRAYPISFIQDRRRSLGSAAGQITEDFPVLPVSHGILTIDCQQVAANTADTPLNLLGKISSFQVLYRGTAIWSLQAVDLYRLGIPLAGWDPPIYTVGQGAAARKLMHILVPFTRNLYSTFECMPATVRGEMQTVITTTADPGTYNNYVYTLEWVQLPDAAPAQFIRATQLQVTPNSTGDFDVDLPRGAPLVGMGVVLSNSEPSSALADIETIKILMANQDTWYAQVFMDSLRPMIGIYQNVFGENTVQHVHIENTAGAYAQNATTLSPMLATGPMREFGWMPFDPTNDGKFILDGTKALDLKARITFNAANTIRLLPVELWNPAMIGKPVGKG